MSQYVTVFGRIVQGQIALKDKIDQITKQPVMKDGQKVQEVYIGLAVPKGSDDWNRIYAAMYAEARAGFPNLFDAQGQCVRQDFAWKLIDGDGRDQEGKPFADREGFAGHYVLKLNTRFLPKCYPSGQFGPGHEMQQPDKFIKPGHWVNVSISVSGNGVVPGGQAKAGLYLSPDKIEHIAIGPEISSSPTAEAAFATHRPQQLPPGAQAIGPGAYQTATPPQQGAAGGLPPPPGVGGGSLPPPPHQAPAGGLPPPPGMAAPAGGLPPPPGVAGGSLPPPPMQQPVKVLTLRPDLAAQGYTIAGLQSQGFDEARLIAEGYATLQ